MVHESSRPKSLTPLQEQVLKFIKETYEATGLPPSYREIQRHFGYQAIGTVQDHVRALIRKGALEKTVFETGARGARGLLPTGYRPELTRRIPIYGEIAAGGARLAEQVELGTMVLSETASKNPMFGLRVVGNSMVEAGILEGDHLIVDQKASVQSGDIVVALLDGETTVKRYVKKTDGIYLVPENRRMKPMRVKTDRFEILGKVIGLQRKF